MEEVETLTAIYGSDLQSLNDQGTCFLVNVRFLSEEIKEEDVIKIWFRYNTFDVTICAKSLVVL